MRVKAALLFSIVLLAPAYFASADALPTAAEILSRADASSGPVPTNYRETIVGTGSLGETKEVTYQSGDDVRHTFDRGGIHEEWGTYHGEDWRQDENGLTFVTTADPGQALPDKTTTTVARVTTPVDAYLVSVLNVRSAGTRTYFDPVTFRRLRVDEVGPLGTKTTTFDDIKHFGASTLPGGWTVSDPAAQLQMHYVRSEYVTNAASAADVGESPSSRQLVEFPPGLTRVNLPVQIVQNSIFVHVKLGSRSVDFLLDTSEPGIMLDDSFARSLGLRLVNAEDEIDAHRYTGFRTLLPEVGIGQLQLHDVVADVAPLTPEQRSNIHPVGILGTDFLAQLGVTIDYSHGTISVVPAADFIPPSDPSTFAIEIRLSQRVPMITVKVDNFIAERVVLATGNDGNLALTDYFARRYPRAFVYDRGIAYGWQGIGGHFTGEYFMFPDLQIGPVHFHNGFGLRINPGFTDDQEDGWIGSALLARFIVDLDYTHGAAYLTPTAETERLLAPVNTPSPQPDPRSAR